MGFFDAFQDILAFMDRGGWVVYLILLALIAIISILLDKVLYLNGPFVSQKAQVSQEWEARAERTSFFAHAIRQDLVASVKLSMHRNMRILKALIALCPLFGLLGTVTGMIEVFEVMSLMGGGNAKAMASGISKATIPTMAGMVAAIVGVLGISVVERMIESREAKLEEQLTFDH